MSKVNIENPFTNCRHFFYVRSSTVDGSTAVKRIYEFYQICFTACPKQFGLSLKGLNCCLHAINVFEGIYFLFKVTYQHIVSHYCCHRGIVTGGKVLIREKVEGIRKKPNIGFSPNKIFLVQRGQSPPIVVVKFQIIIEVRLKPIYLSV